MRLNEISFEGVLPVDGYGPGFFRIGGQVVTAPLLLRPGQVSAWGGLADTAPLVALAGEIDILFVGTGNDIVPLPTSLRTALENCAIGVEMMASPAACRSYNVVLAEGRRIAAALLPVS